MESAANVSRSTRRRKADTAYCELLEAVIAMKPEAFGLDSAGWTAEALRQVMQEQTGIAISDHRFHALLHARGYVFQLVPQPTRIPRARTVKELNQLMEQIMVLPMGKAVRSWQKKR